MITSSSIKNAVVEAIKNCDNSVTIGKRISGSIVNTAVNLSSVTVRKEAIASESSRPFIGVMQNNLTQRKIHNQEFERLYQMKVVFFSVIDDLRLNQSLDEVGDALMDVLSEIQVPAGLPDNLGAYKKYIVRGLQMDYKIQDEIMTFFVSYPIRVYKEKIALPKMEDITVNTEII